MSDAVHDENADKLGCRIALALEEQFIAASWPTGQFAGTEEMLSRRFGVSRRIVREATRVLGMRGTARLKRGLTLGLEITPPDVELIVDIMRGYAYLNGIDAAQRIEALSFLERVGRRLLAIDEAVSAHAFLIHFIRDELTPGVSPRGVGRERFRKLRAGQIAIDIMEEFFAKSFEPGRRIGSEGELSSRFCADRSITRQAIRLLESSGLVASMPGRGNGIIIQRPPSGPVCRLICCLYASRGLSMAAAFELFHAMGVEAVALVAAKADDEDVRKLRSAFLCGSQPQQLGDLMCTEDSQLEAIRNPLIDLCIRSVRGYVALTIAKNGTAIQADVAHCFTAGTQDVHAAIARRDPEAAVRAHERKFSAMRELEIHYNPTLAGLLYDH